MKRRVLLIGLLLISMLFAGCTSGTSQTPAATATPLKTAEPTAAASPTATVAVTENQIGYVLTASVTGGKNYISIDYVQFLTGQAAIDAAKTDGVAQKDSQGHWYVDNDYYIVNDNTKIRTFEVAPTASIKVLKTGSSELKSVTFSQFMALGPTFASGKMLMHCNVVGGIVVALEQQFVP
jgi:hypothetical protein